jgi:hypothetical protein
MIGVGLGVSLLGIINRRPLIITGVHGHDSPQPVLGHRSEGGRAAGQATTLRQMPRPRQRRRCATLEWSEALRARQAPDRLRFATTPQLGHPRTGCQTGRVPFPIRPLRPLCPIPSRALWCRIGRAELGGWRVAAAVVDHRHRRRPAHLRPQSAARVRPDLIVEVSADLPLDGLCWRHPTRFALRSVWVPRTRSRHATCRYS